MKAPAARRLEVTSVRNPVAWTAAVETAAKRLRAGDAAKVVLAREVVARGDGVVSAGMVARSLRAAYPSCFTYLVTGADGTAFAGASPELLVRRSGGRAYSQPMAGSVARGTNDVEDDRPHALRKILAEAEEGAAVVGVHEREGTEVTGGLAAQLFRAGVLRRPDDLAELREQRVLYGPLVGGLCDAEIDHLRDRRAVLFHHQHIRRLQVTVDHTLLVRMLDRTADREE